MNSGEFYLYEVRYRNWMNNNLSDYLSTRMVIAKTQRGASSRVRRYYGKKNPIEIQSIAKINRVDLLP